MKGTPPVNLCIFSYDRITFFVYVTLTLTP